MIETAMAIYDDLAAALAPTPLYVDSRPESAPIPHGWLYSGDTSPGISRDLYSDIVYVHLWAATAGGAGELEGAVSFLDGHTVSGYGDLVGARYLLSSVVRTREEGGWHVSRLHECKYYSARKLAG